MTACTILVTIMTAHMGAYEAHRVPVDRGRLARIAEYSTPDGTARSRLYFRDSGTPVLAFETPGAIVDAPCRHRRY